MTYFCSRIKWPDQRRPRISFSAADMARRYGFPVLESPSQQCVAIISLGGGYSPNDLAAYCQRFGLPVPPATFVSVQGATNDYTGDPNSADMENALDIQNVVGATCGKIGIFFYGAPNTDAGFAAAINAAIQGPACVGSISWGSDERSWSAPSMSLMNAAFARGILAGIPFYAASGDDGSSDGDPGNNVDFPASSPNTIGCGGTSLVSAVESAWSYGGGGLSRVFPANPWQPKNLSRRSVPDVAGNADPNSGYEVCLNGQWYTIGGTSAVAPLWAAGHALMVAVNGNRPTNWAQILYQLNALTDITVGSNGAYRAGPGYDLCTGLGVPNANFWKLATAQASAPPPAPVSTNGGASSMTWQQLLQSVLSNPQVQQLSSALANQLLQYLLGHFGVNPTGVTASEVHAVVEQFIADRKKAA